MNCPRCGTPMSGGVCPECGFPVTAVKVSVSVSVRDDYKLIPMCLDSHGKTIRS